MKGEGLFNQRIEDVGVHHKSEPIVLSTRIRLARNLNAMPFPHHATQEQRESVLLKCQEVIQSVNYLSQATYMNVEDLSEFEKQVLVEKHLMSRELLGEKEGSGVVISRDQKCSIMINEEDHLRIQFVSRGFDFEMIWEHLSIIDDRLEERLDYAFSMDYGYLTSCPTNLGTGMRASVMLHLPGLVIAKQIESVIRASTQLGIAVRGLFGEGSEASGSIFQFSNQQSLGEKEESIIERVSKVFYSIIEQEKNARLKFMEENPYQIFDKIGRAYGILCNSFIITSNEAMNLLSLMRLAIDLKIMPESLRAIIDNLFIECQPGHLQIHEKNAIEAHKRDILRGDFIREKFSHFPAPEFHKTI